ncbi:MAG TPA: hypothetical protein VFK38_10820 [Candidatus Limnocylindrales bacterium]|nr:hypothetical protein [Candidatus Limnocylindrales bacterium]
MRERPHTQSRSGESRSGAAPACGLCHRPVGLRQAARARLGWRSLVVCDRCLDSADTLEQAGLGAAA